MVAQTQQEPRPLIRQPEARPVQAARPTPQSRTLIAYLGDLDTYRRGPVWHTIWHKEALPHGLDVQAFRSLGGQTIEVGQELLLHGEAGQGVRFARVTAIRVIDPAQANGTLAEAAIHSTGRTATIPVTQSPRCWLITVE